MTFELQVGGQADKQTDRHTHINTMTQPGLGAGPIEKERVKIKIRGNSPPPQKKLYVFKFFVGTQKKFCGGRRGGGEEWRAEGKGGSRVNIVTRSTRLYHRQPGKM